MSTDTPGPGERLLTIEELERLPDDAYQYELVRGRLIREPLAGGEHSALGVKVVRLIGNFVERQGLGFVFGADTGFVLQEEPPTVRAPDAAFVAAERLPNGPPMSFARLAPDLAVEVVSPSDTLAAVQSKAFDYLDAGTRMVWVVDPATRSVTVYRSRDDIRTLPDSDVLDGGDVLPGFGIQIGTLFTP